jgi:hypothetical protein
LLFAFAFLMSGQWKSGIRSSFFSLNKQWKPFSPFYCRCLAGGKALSFSKLRKFHNSELAGGSTLLVHSANYLGLKTERVLV